MSEHQPNNVSAAGVLSEAVTVPRAPIEWLKTHYPALCEKAGLCERVGGRLYTRTVAAASAQATGQAVQFTPSQLATLYMALGHFKSSGSVKCADSIMSIIKMDRG